MVHTSCCVCFNKVFCEHVKIGIRCCCSLWTFAPSGFKVRRERTEDISKGPITFK